MSFLVKGEETFSEETPMSLRLTTVYEKGVEWGGCTQRQEIGCHSGAMSPKKRLIWET